MEPACSDTMLWYLFFFSIGVVVCLKPKQQRYSHNVTSFTKVINQVALVATWDVLCLFAVNNNGQRVLTTEVCVA